MITLFIVVYDHPVVIYVVLCVLWCVYCVVCVVFVLCCVYCVGSQLCSILPRHLWIQVWIRDEVTA